MARAGLLVYAPPLEALTRRCTAFGRAIGEPRFWVPISAIESMSEPAGVLGWDALDEIVPTSAPLVICSTERETIDLALSRLAGETLAGGGRILWLSGRGFVQPLAWMRCRETRLEADASPADWPEVSVFDLSPSFITRWAAYELGAESRVERRILAAAVGEVIALGQPESHAEGMEIIRDAFEARARELLGDDWTGFRTSRFADQSSPAGDRTEIDFRENQFTLVHGPARAMARNGDALCLLALAFISEAAVYLRDGRYLLVLDGVWDLLDSAQRTLIGNAIIEHASDPYGGTVLTSPDPAVWETDLEGASLLAACVPLIASDFGARWPDVWGEEAPRTSVDAHSPRKVAAPELLQPPRPRMQRTWRWFEVPSPITHPVPGASIVDDED